MGDPVHFDIDDGAASPVLVVGNAVEELATHFLKLNHRSPDFLHSRPSDAIRAKQAALQLSSAFSPGNSTSVQERQLAYLQFISTIVELTKSPGEFSRKLKSIKINERPLVEAIYNNISQLFYKKSGMARQIRDHWNAHLEIIKGNWFPNQRRLEEQNQRGFPRPR